MMTRLKYFFQPYNQLGEPITKLIKPFFNLVERHNQFGEPFSKLIKPFFKVCGRLENFRRSLAKTGERLENFPRSLEKTRGSLENSRKLFAKMGERLNHSVLRAKQNGIPFKNPVPWPINPDGFAKDPFCHPELVSGSHNLCILFAPSVKASAIGKGCTWMKPNPAAIQIADEGKKSKNWPVGARIPNTRENGSLNNWIKYFGKLSSSYSIEWWAGWQRVIFSYGWYEKHQ